MKIDSSFLLTSYLHKSSNSDLSDAKYPYIFKVSNGTIQDFDYFYLNCMCWSCILKNTPITLSDNTTKLIQDIDYQDDLLVWNFDDGKYDSAKPLWIKKPETASYYYHCIFDDGTTLNLVGSDGKCHRLFNCDTSTFKYAVDCVGSRIMTLDGIKVLNFCERVEEECEFYNIITNYHMNIYTNGILTSCRYNNLYPIQDMKFAKDDRKNIYYKKNFNSIPAIYYTGLRLREQKDISVEDTIKYVQRLESKKMKINDFEENKEICTDINQVEVGYIDEEGNVYGFKKYMLGQSNHGTLAELICKEKNIEPEKLGGYERSLELLGYTRFSQEYFNGSTNEHQIEKLNNFLKARGKNSIKLGNTWGEAIERKALYKDNVTNIKSKMNYGKNR